MSSSPTEVFCVAGGWDSTRDAEHGYSGLGGLVATTAFVATTFEPEERVVVSGADDVSAMVQQARLFVFPGHEELHGPWQVADLLARTSIDEIRGIAGLPVRPTDVVETQGFVRPSVESGRVVLVVRPYDDGSERQGRASFIPFEQPNPTPCCADH